MSVRPSGELQAGTHRLPLGDEGPTLTMELLMKKSRKSLVRPRTRAYNRQSGRCFYCGVPMWRKESLKFASHHNISLKQARLIKCTGEHFTAHCEGGGASRSNIVAACWFCNIHRHRAAKVLIPSKYREYVRKRVAKGRWHQLYRLCS